MYEIIVKADTNDADYITEMTEITQEELDLIRPLVEAIRRFKPYTVELDGRSRRFHHNYPNSEYSAWDLGEKSPRELYDFPEEVHQTFEELVPYGEYGTHTIESVTVRPIVGCEVLL